MPRWFRRWRGPMRQGAAMPPERRSSRACAALTGLDSNTGRGVQPGREGRGPHLRIGPDRHPRQEPASLLARQFRSRHSRRSATASRFLHAAGATLKDVVEVGVLLTT